MQSFLKSGKLDLHEKLETPSVKQTKKVKLLPWVEKYRPRVVNDVVEQSDAVAVLQECIKGADLPNLLFYGPPGTGKTSTILAAARQLFGEYYRDRILELNASDERGIQVIRDKVKTFAQLTASGTRPDGKPCPPFKIVILDEADSMTHAAQAALRRTMEKETRSTRFCLICNYVSRIIEPLTSRCTKFRFKPLNDVMIRDRLKFISEKESVKCDDESLKLIVQASGGDLRRAITCLQCCAKLKCGEQITTETILDVTGVVPEQWIIHFLNICRTRDHMKFNEFLHELLLEAYSTSQLMEQLHEVIVASEEFSDSQKAIIGEKIGINNMGARHMLVKYLSGNITYTNATIANGVVRITMNDAKTRNSLSINMMESLLANISDHGKNLSVRAIVITANGPVFSAGHNLKELTEEYGIKQQTKVFNLASQLMYAIIDCPVPIIARVNGIAAAAGCQLVAQCDLAFCSEKSTFSTPGANFGLFCSTPGVALARSVPKNTALHMLLTGRPISSTEAESRGLINKACPEESLDLEINNCIETIKEKSRTVIEMGKKFYYKQVTTDVKEAYNLGGEQMVANLQLDDSKEGLHSFIEKRKPQWK